MKNAPVRYVLLLEQKGYQIIGFSAAGIGDRAMENMIAEGFFQGVIDLAPGGVGEHLFGFMRDAGPNRLETAGKLRPSTNYLHLQCQPHDSGQVQI